MAADIRADFPILQREHQNKPLVYLDNAATTQKPQAVIDALSNYYSRHNANVHRAAHFLADEATQMLEEARTLTAQFINAAQSSEVIMTRGTTEAINLVANIVQGEVKSGDEILLTSLEHHSNIVPWQMLAQRTGAVIKVVAVTPSGDLDLDSFSAQLSART
ncbi:MAG: aminotransferase class V-fold PLP-dependent enzyme, partial [Pseudomonadota bacterium]